MQTEFSNDDGTIEINSYRSAEKTVFYVASRSLEEMDLELDFSTLVSNFTEATGVKIGQDQSFKSSDGVHFTPRDGYQEADYVLVEGERYYINENDVRAELTDCTFDGTWVGLNPKPFEVMEITFMHQGFLSAGPNRRHGKPAIVACGLACRGACRKAAPLPGRPFRAGAPLPGGLAGCGARGGCYLFTRGARQLRVFRAALFLFQSLLMQGWAPRGSSCGH